MGASIVRDPESPPTGNGSNGTSGNGSGGNSFDDKKAEESARTFGIRPKNNNRTYILRAATVEEAEEWIASLRRVAAAAAAGTTTPAATTAAQLTAPHPRSNKRIVRRLFDELCYGCRQSFTFIRRRHHCRNVSQKSENARSNACAITTAILLLQRLTFTTLVILIT